MQNCTMGSSPYSKERWQLLTLMPYSNWICLLNVYVSLFQSKKWRSNINKILKKKSVCILKSNGSTRTISTSIAGSWSACPVFPFFCTRLPKVLIWSRAPKVSGSLRTKGSQTSKKTVCLLSKYMLNWDTADSVPESPAWISDQLFLQSTSTWPATRTLGELGKQLWQPFRLTKRFDFSVSIIWGGKKNEGKGLTWT